MSNIIKISEDCLSKLKKIDNKSEYNLFDKCKENFVIEEDRKLFKLIKKDNIEKKCIKYIQEKVLPNGKITREELYENCETFKKLNKLSKAKQMKGKRVRKGRAGGATKNLMNSINKLDADKKEKDELKKFFETVFKKNQEGNIDLIKNIDKAINDYTQVICIKQLNDLREDIVEITSQQLKLNWEDIAKNLIGWSDDKWILSKPLQQSLKTLFACFGWEFVRRILSKGWELWNRITPPPRSPPDNPPDIGGGGSKKDDDDDDDDDDKPDKGNSNQFTDFQMFMRNQAQQQARTQQQTVSSRLEQDIQGSTTGQGQEKVKPKSASEIAKDKYNEEMKDYNRKKEEFDKFQKEYVKQEKERATAKRDGTKIRERTIKPPEFMKDYNTLDNPNFNIPEPIKPVDKTPKTKPARKPSALDSGDLTVNPLILNPLPADATDKEQSERNNVYNNALKRNKEDRDKLMKDNNLKPLEPQLPVYKDDYLKGLGYTPEQITKYNKRLEEREDNMVKFTNTMDNSNIQYTIPRNIVNEKEQADALKERMGIPLEETNKEGEKKTIVPENTNEIKKEEFKLTPSGDLNVNADFKDVEDIEREITGSSLERATIGRDNETGYIPNVEEKTTDASFFDKLFMGASTLGLSAYGLTQSQSQSQIQPLAIEGSIPQQLYNPDDNLQPRPDEDTLTREADDELKKLKRDELEKKVKNQLDSLDKSNEAKAVAGSFLGFSGVLKLRGFPMTTQIRDDELLARNLQEELTLRDTAPLTIDRNSLQGQRTTNLLERERSLAEQSGQLGLGYEDDDAMVSNIEEDEKDKLIDNMKKQFIARGEELKKAEKTIEDNKQIYNNLFQQERETQYFKREEERQKFRQKFRQVIRNQNTLNDEENVRNTVENQLRGLVMERNRPQRSGIYNREEVMGDRPLQPMRSGTIDIESNIGDNVRNKVESQLRGLVMERNRPQRSGIYNREEVMGDRPLQPMRSGTINRESIVSRNILAPVRSGITNRQSGLMEVVMGVPINPDMGEAKLSEETLLELVEKTGMSPPREVLNLKKGGFILPNDEGRLDRLLDRDDEKKPSAEPPKKKKSKKKKEPEKKKDYPQPINPRKQNDSPDDAISVFRRLGDIINERIPMTMNDRTLYRMYAGLYQLGLLTVDEINEIYQKMKVAFKDVIALKQSFTLSPVEVDDLYGETIQRVNIGLTNNNIDTKVNLKRLLDLLKSLPYMKKVFDILEKTYPYNPKKK